MSSSTPHGVDAADAALRQIDALLDELSTLARAPVDPSHFLATLVDRVVSGVAAIGGTVWIRETGEAWRAAHRVGPDDGRQSPDAARIADVAAEGRPRMFAPGATGGTTENPTPWLLLVAPWRVDGFAEGVLEVRQRGDTAPAARAGQLRFVAEAAEIAADHDRERHRRALAASTTTAGRRDAFGRHAHASLDTASCAQAIAHEGRRLLDCDRVSVLVRRGRHYRLLSASGTDQIDRRAPLVRRLEELAGLALATGQPLWYPADAARLAPEVEPALEAYLDESHARTLGVIPLTAPTSAVDAPHSWEEESTGHSPDAPARGTTDFDAAPFAAPFAALVVERFQDAIAGDLPRETARITPDAAIALRNALFVERLPLWPLERMLLGVRWLAAARRRAWTLLAIGGVAAVVAALVLVRTELNVESRGALQPVVRRDVFAARDGIVAEVRVRHGERVAAGEVVARLHDPDLEQSVRRVSGEAETVRARLDAVEALRIDDGRDAAAPGGRGQLAAEREQLREKLAGLEAENEVLAAARDDLRLASPIEGEVLTWNVDALLTGRPVARGQTLVRVADLDADWVVELDVPEDRAGHLLAAPARGRDLPVEFLLASDPGRRWRGRVAEASLVSEADPENPAAATVRVVVACDEPPPAARPGAAVVARVSCGRHRLGYVWLHRLWEAVASRVWW